MFEIQYSLQSPRVVCLLLRCSHHLSAFDLRFSLLFRFTRPVPFISRALLLSSAHLNSSAYAAASSFSRNSIRHLRPCGGCWSCYNCESGHPEKGGSARAAPSHIPGRHSEGNSVLHDAASYLLPYLPFASHRGAATQRMRGDIFFHALRYTNTSDSRFFFSHCCFSLLLCIPFPPRLHPPCLLSSYSSAVPIAVVVVVIVIVIVIVNVGLALFPALSVEWRPVCALD